ncbi:unnamed protein product [Rotaria sp. Silwood1]|nr:unnamed protein product [Rotaria sp. Silwood1]
MALSQDCHFLSIVRSENQATSSSDATESPALFCHTNVKPHRSFNSRIVQNFILVWLNSIIDDVSDDELCDSIAKLQQIVNSINTFTDVDECIDFLTEIKDEKVLIIISDEYGQDVVSFMHDLNQINSIYIFCKNEPKENQSTQNGPKVKNIFFSISSICKAVKLDAQKCDQDSISISLVSNTSGTLNSNLDQLDPTFMYTQILKEILLTIDFNEQHIKDFTAYYRQHFADNTAQLNKIDEFEKDYNKHPAIWWYTHQFCFYSVLNRALRLMEIDTLIKMGFFIHDLHHQIARLHSKQLNEQHQSESLTIFRGQGISKTEFEKILKTQGGLISFNNFLSTSKDLSIAQSFARSSLANSGSVGVVFVMTIDPSIDSTPFASINDLSCYNTEEEILFSMHTVFRIGSIIQSNDNNRLWQVDLIQTNDNDPELNHLTKRIREEIRGSSEWDRLAGLLIKLGQFAKADELYEVLVNQTCNDHQKIHFYHQLGWSKKNQKKYEEAITFYEKSLEIKYKILPEKHSSFTSTFNDIGSVYENINQYTQALLYYERGLIIQQQITNQHGLASSLSSIGSVYEKMRDYPTALSYHEKALEIRQNMQPSDDRKVAHSYKNIAVVYEKMGEYAKALSSHEKSLEALKRILPPNHSDLAQLYSSIGFLYGKMRQNAKSLEVHQRALDIGQRSLPVNHPRLQQLQKNLECATRKYK